MGTRLFPETESKPKILVKVNGKTILEHQLDVLTQFADLKNIHLIFQVIKVKFKRFRK